MTPRQVIGLDGVLDENCSAVLANKLSFAVVVLATEQASPGFFEVVRHRMELSNRVTNKGVALRVEEAERRWICFETCSPVIQNQNAVEGVVEYGLEFAFRGIENAGSFAILAAGQNKEAGVKDDRRTKGDQYEREQH